MVKIHYLVQAVVVPAGLRRWLLLAGLLRSKLAIHSPSLSGRPARRSSACMRGGPDQLLASTAARTGRPAPGHLSTRSLGYRFRQHLARLLMHSLPAR